MSLWSRVLRVHEDKLKILLVQNLGAYSHQPWQDGDLPWAAPAHKVNWPFGQGVFQDREMNLKHYISTFTIPMATKIGRLVTYNEELSFKELPYPLMTRLCDFTWQTKIIISPLPQYLWPLNVGWWLLALRGFSIKSIDPLLPWSS